MSTIDDLKNDRLLFEVLGEMPDDAEEWKPADQLIHAADIIRISSRFTDIKPYMKRFKEIFGCLN